MHMSRNFYSVFQARASTPTSPQACTPLCELGSKDVTNTGLFTALPSLVITLLRAPADCQDYSVALLMLYDSQRHFGKPPLAHCLYAPIDICLKIILQSVCLQMRHQHLGLLLTELLPKTAQTRTTVSRPQTKAPSWFCPHHLSEAAAFMGLTRGRIVKGNLSIMYPHLVMDTYF